MARRRTGPGINTAFERAAKAAERRLQKATAEQERLIQRAGKKAASELSAAAQAALKAAIRSVEEIAKTFQLDAEEARRLRQGLETAQGAVDGAKRGAAALAFAGPKGAGVGALIGAVFGGVLGFSQDDIRQQVARVREEFERDRAEFQRLIASIEQDTERLRSARRRSGRLG